MANSRNIIPLPLKTISMTFSFMVHWMWKLGSHCVMWTGYQEKKEKRNHHKNTHKEKQTRWCKSESGRKEKLFTEKKKPLMTAKRTHPPSKNRMKIKRFPTIMFVGTHLFIWKTNKRNHKIKIAAELIHLLLQWDPPLPIAPQNSRGRCIPRQIFWSCQHSRENLMPIFTPQSGGERGRERRDAESLHGRREHLW